MTSPTPRTLISSDVVEIAESLVQEIIETSAAHRAGDDVTIDAIAACKKVKRLEFKDRLFKKFKNELSATLWNEKLKEAVARLQKHLTITLPAKEGEPDLLAQGMTDDGNTERLMAVHGRDIRYCPSMKKWLIWDGRRWAIDEVNRIQELTVGVMRQFLAQAAERSSGDEWKFAHKSLSYTSICRATALATSRVTVMPRDLDTDPWALNCLNGTIDLRTGVLEPHDREDLITKLIHHNYEKDARCDVWLRFLWSAMGDSEDATPEQVEKAGRLVAYIQRALGYSITGSTIEKAVFIPLGEFGNNGKSTMLDTIRKIIREYSALLQVDTLMVRQESNNTQSDLADLRGARFVQTSETEESQSLSQGKLKLLTAGMGTIRAARKFENFVEFEQTFHIWLDTNKMPFIKDPDDTATLARLHPIPFLVQIPDHKIDQQMPEKLQAEAVGILAWMVEGARLWFANKLGKPPEILSAREEWRTSQNDPWGQAVEAWINERHDNYVQMPNAPPYFRTSTASVLEHALGFKIKDMGQHRGDSTRVGRILKAAGMVKDGQAGALKTRMYRFPELARSEPTPPKPTADDDEEPPSLFPE